MKYSSFDIIKSTLEAFDIPSVDIDRILTDLARHDHIELWPPYGDLVDATEIGKVACKLMREEGLDVNEAFAKAYSKSPTVVEAHE